MVTVFTHRRRIVWTGKDQTFNQPGKTGVDQGGQPRPYSNRISPSVQSFEAIKVMRGKSYEKPNFQLE